MIISKYFSQQVVASLNSGGVGIGLTDTLYGVLARADKPEACARVYQIKGRNPAKPLIVLIADLTQLASFSVADEDIDRAKDYWPGPITLILKTPHAPEHLVGQDGTIAFRLPDSYALRKLIRHTGPLVAPSANPEGELPARTIRKARSYFGDTVDFYVGSNRLVNRQPSTLLSLVGAAPAQLR